MYTVLFVDYGNQQYCAVDDIRLLREEFATFPCFCFPALFSRVRASYITFQRFIYPCHALFCQVSFDSRKDLQQWTKVASSISKLSEFELRVIQFITKCPLPFIHLYARSAETHSRQLVNDMLGCDVMAPGFNIIM